MTESDQSLRPRSGVATSLILAIGNVGMIAACEFVARLSQDAVPAWIWALSFLWLLTLGPAILPLAVLIFAARDLSKGQRFQGLAAIAIAVVTSVASWGRIEVGF
jgi:hypothetical protein